MDLIPDICNGCGEVTCTWKQCIPLTQVPVYQPPLFLGLQKGPGGQSLLVGKTAVELEADKKAEHQRQLRRAAIAFLKGVEWVNFCAKQAGLCKCPECETIAQQGVALVSRAPEKDRTRIVQDIMSCKKMNLDKTYLVNFWDYAELARYGITV